MSESISEAITVGRELLFVSNDRRVSSQRWTVTKIGRKWITFDSRYRADKETLKVDGGQYSSPGQMWLSEEEYEDAARLGKLWHDLLRTFRDFAYRNRPEHINEADIHQIAAILDIDLAEEKENV